MVTDMGECAAPPRRSMTSQAPTIKMDMSNYSIYVTTISLHWQFTKTGLALHLVFKI